MQQREIRTLVDNSSVQLERESDKQTDKEYKVLNISRGGLCFESKTDEFQLNEVIKLNLTIDKHSIHKANGRVCYCNDCSGENPTAYGLSFLDKFIDTDVLRGKPQPDKT
ncbi:MAG: hypothetical protein DIZ80_15955 [endosymbiont of Galathealinum brachiosum]|uniref:PilZ domain-containing protein n=1 Tax=endosymbiont of Galathealinum brachiosum TaxID=2200906 RepID=A0A370D9J7_9GAMM|nr:MAG: hypothetical protein DIZ80_15955 [endosymbiont of Galathealinum brachiosum]